MCEQFRLHYCKNDATPIPTSATRKRGCSAKQRKNKSCPPPSPLCSNATNPLETLLFLATKYLAAVSYIGAMLSRATKSLAALPSTWRQCYLAKRNVFDFLAARQRFLAKIKFRDVLVHSDNVISRHESPCPSLVHIGSTLHPIRRLGVESFPISKRFRLARYSKYRPPDPNEHHRGRQKKTKTAPQVMGAV